ncbi:MAG TPA: DUF2249 domain-containing protein [Chloroflexota bacterium]|nr:DUF2249 domain-containing protein [Chloroflexota bacterium]
MTPFTPAAPPPAGPPIDGTWKVSQVLDRYPALIETLAGLYPGFARLRNPVLRALRAPRISVAQAAKVAGLDAAAMVRALNEAAHVPVDADSADPEVASAPPETRSPDVPEREAETAEAPVVHIDVRELPPPEPMLRILEALEHLPPGSTLLVTHARRPIYLYPRLDALGCTHETRELGPGNVEIVIHKLRQQA